MTFLVNYLRAMLQCYKEYELTSEEQAALASGDVRWIESHIGKKLNEQLMTKVMIPLLSRERW